MSVSRPRKRGREGFPPNLYTNPLRYRHPKTGQVFSWRKHTLEKAIEAAKILNSMLVDSDPVSEVLGDKNTFGKFLREFITKDGYLDQRKSERDLSEETISAYIRKVAILQKKDIAKKPTAEVTTFDLAELIKEYPTTQRNRYRSLLILIFDYAVSAGLTESNPARALMKKLEKVKRRRLTIEGFDAVYEKADVKTRQAMRLAIRSLQRREDLVRLKTGDIDSDPRGGSSR
jgi:integrase